MKLKKFLVIGIVISMLIVSTSLPVSSKTINSIENNSEIEIIQKPAYNSANLENDKITSTPVIGFGDEFGVWILI